MADSAHKVRTNWRDVLHKLAGFVLSDDADDPPSVAVAFIEGSGAPAGAYWLAAYNINVAIYIQNDAASVDEAEWVTIDQGTTWAKKSVLTALSLAATTDITIAAGVGTLTAAVHTVRGEAAAPDNLDTLAGIADAGMALLITGAEAITYRDAAVGGGNISTTGNASIVTATGDLVLAARSGAVYSLTPLSIASAAAYRTFLGLAIGTDVQAYDADLAALAGLASAADKVPYFTGAGTADVADLTAFGRTLIAAAAAAAARSALGLDTGDSPTFANLLVTGKLLMQGAVALVDAEHIDLRSNYLFLNTDYTTAVAQASGIVANYLPTATVDATTGAGVVVAGVDGVSDPTITTDSAGNFAATDFVMISGSANDGENDGLYEVASHAGNVLTLKSTGNGITNRVEGWTQDQLVANAGDVGMTLTKVTLSVLRCGADGLWEVGTGSQTPITFVDIPTAAQVALASDQLWPMAVYGAWAIDGDGAETNGAGLVGATPTLTEQAAALAKIEDGGVFANLSDSAGEAGYTGAYQLFPDAPVAETDFAYFGGAIPFPELAFNVSATNATFDAAGVLAWTYWDGAAWSPLTLAHDGSSASTADGTLAFGRDGAIAFIPPSDWASSSVDGQAAFWIRCGIAAGKAANLTQVPLLDAKEHELVTPNGGFVARQTGTIESIRLVDGATTLHTTADVKFILVNFTTGAHSGELTFTQDLRCQVFTGLSLTVAAGDVLGVVVTQEDTGAEPSGVLLELGVAI